MIRESIFHAETYSTFFRISANRSQNLGIVAISSRSSGEWTPAQRRTERNHLQMRIFLEEQAALQTGMDRTHLGLHTEKFLIAGNRDFQQFRLGLGAQPG